MVLNIVAVIHGELNFMLVHMSMKKAELGPIIFPSSSCFVNNKRLFGFS